MHLLPPTSPKSLKGRLLVGSLLFCCLGCASGANGPLTTWRVNDPPKFSPYARKLSQPDPASTTQEVGRPPNVGTTIEQVPDPSPPFKPDSTPQDTADEQIGSDAGELAAPKPADTFPEASSAGDEPSANNSERLQVTIACPKQARRGDEVHFQILVENNDQHPLPGVVVTCRLPDGLVFPDAPQRAFRQQLGRLDVDQQETLHLTLRCEDVGQHCVEFEVSADGLDEIVSKSACVECLALTAAVSLNALELTGPIERSVGTRAEFVLTLRNLTGVEQHEVHVLLEHEGVLEPREASAGAVRRPGQLKWDLGLLRIDERVQIQVEFECLSKTDETCVTASATGRSLTLGPVKSCLTTTPEKAIDLDIVDQQDPVMIGERVTYVIEVTNSGLSALSHAFVSLQADGLQPVSLTVGDDESPTGATFDRDTGLITVPLPEELAPDVRQTITLKTLATRAGAGHLKASMTQRETSLLISTTEPTVVNPLGGPVAWDDR